MIKFKCIGSKRERLVLKMKKILVALSIIMLLLGLVVGCAPEVPDETEIIQETSINAGVFYYSYDDSYISSVRESLDENLETAGIGFTNYDGTTNQKTQTEQIETAIANGANLLIVNLVENSSVDTAQNIVNLAKDNEIPVVFFNREISSDVVNSYDLCAFVGTNTQEAGQMQGDLIGDYLIENYDETDLNGDGIISYVLFKGQEGNPEADLRTKFSVLNANAKLQAAEKPELVFFEEGSSEKYYVDQNGAWSAQAATNYMNMFLTQYTQDNGNMIELVISNNDEMAKGAITALNEVGYNTGEQDSVTIPVFGVDATEAAQQLIAQGMMTGTIKQDAISMAESIAIFARNLNDGDDFKANLHDLNVDENTTKVRVPYSVYTG